MSRAPITKAVAINVGANKNEEWGGFRGPIFADGRFHFIHIPWKDHYGKIVPPPKKYSEMDYEPYVPANLKYKYVLISPDFKNKTYASTKGAPANKPLLDLFAGNYLFFYATLDFVGDISARKEWINPNWGAYLVGLFKVKIVYDSLKRVLSDKEATKNFMEYAWYKSMRANKYTDDNAPWIKGSEEGSGLLKEAIPLSDSTDSQKWSKIACEFFRTAKGHELDQNKKAVFQTVLTCEGDRLEGLLSRCELRKE